MVDVICMVWNIWKIQLWKISFIFVSSAFTIEMVYLKIIQMCPVRSTHDLNGEPMLISSWWRHQMITFSALLAHCEGNPPIIGGFPSQRPVTPSFDVFCDMRLNKRLRKQSRRRWFETPSPSSWRHCNDVYWNFGNNLQRKSIKIHFSRKII